MRQMLPVAAPAEQRDKLLALAQFFRDDAATSQPRPGFELVSPSGMSIEVPASVLALLEGMIAVLARGDAISLVPVSEELTTQQAANLLNMSRQYFVRLLDSGKIPHRRLGTHRRVRMQDVLEYKRF